MSSMPPIPQPVLPLDYPPPMRNARPGIVTAIGVMSIVVAAISMLASMIFGFYAIGISVASYASQQAAGARATAVNVRMTSVHSHSTVAVSDTPATGDVLPTGPRGLAPEVRLFLLKQLEGNRSLNDEQRDRLTQLLAKAGKDVFPFADPASDDFGPLSSTIVRNNISASGQLPSSTGGDGAVYFVVGNGKLEIYDDHAVFFPSDGSATIRVAKGLPDDDLIRLTTGDIDAIIARVKSLSAGNPGAPAPSQVQLTALRNALADPEQNLVRLGPGSPSPVQQIISSVTGTDGSMMIMTSTNGFVQIDKQGTLTDSTTAAFNAMGSFRIRTSAIVLSVLEAIGSALLAIYLLVIGILVLRQNLAGRKLHLIYAWLKLPLVAMGVLGWMWLIMDFTSSFSRMIPSGAAGGAPPANVASPMALGFTIMLSIGAVLAAAYPIALLIALRARSVRDYYNSVQA